MFLEVVRNVFYLLTILSVTVTWILAAVFLSKTQSSIDAYYNGNVMLLAFGAMAMLVLPILAVLGSEKRRRDVAGVTIAESIIIFIFWCLFLSGSSKFTSEYTSGFSWNDYCGYFSYCGVGRSCLGWAWISFGLLTILFVVALASGMFRFGEEKEKEEFTAGGGGGGLVPLESNDPRTGMGEGEKKNEGSSFNMPPPVPAVK